MGYELVVQVRDLNGVPTGQTKSLKTSSPEDLDSFWSRNSGVKKRGGGRKQSPSKSDKIKKNLIADIDKLKKLQPGWDGQSAKPVNGLILEKSKDIVTSLADAIKFSPKVVPMAGGNFQLEFSSNKTNKELEIEFTDVDTITYLMWDSATGFSEEKSVGTNEIAKIRWCLNWLIK